MVGRYPDFDVMQSADTWDDATRAVVEQRLRSPTDLRFFDAAEAVTAAAFSDTVTAQDREPRVPVVAMIDKKYAESRHDGYRYDDMPDDATTWHLALRGLDEVARRRYGSDFAGCPNEVRNAIVEQFAGGSLQGGVWDTFNCKRAFSVLMRGVLAEFYSHPWAWNEIGFGGPAYPRGYMRLGEGLREPHEKPEALQRDPVRDTETAR
ncbi:MAG: gluconate 2-dehydrogenase subunit 3 family protein [Candidatus Dormibacteraeota bacterium]|nr:gluconate 2-dehydrogenase subunit 3 family protein [Candidatus Dormibacteraeota bacterium]MBV8445291.1 gluconate 2-dehydrogenase subunit 3 family protein [Candidatus Dormibacteraeota bacterium]